MPMNEAFTMRSEAHAGMGMRAEVQYRQSDDNSTLVLRLTTLETDEAAPVEVTRIDSKTVEITVSGGPEVDEFATILKLLLDRLSERRPILVGEYSVHVENTFGNA